MRENSKLQNNKTMTLGQSWPRLAGMVLGLIVLAVLLVSPVWAQIDEGCFDSGGEFNDRPSAECAQQIEDANEEALEEAEEEITEVIEAIPPVAEIAEPSLTEPPVFIPFQSGSVAECSGEAFSRGLRVGAPCLNVMIGAAFSSFYACMGRNDLYDYTADRFNDHRDWFTDIFLVEQFIPALQLFSEQMVTVGAMQTFSIGTFFDAKHQLETQRLFQELQVEAHKDYQPSESFCKFGTAVRSMAHTDSTARMTALALSRRQMARHLGQENIGGAQKKIDDKINRWNQFTQRYCDQKDNDWMAEVLDSGLSSVCNPPNAGNRESINVDIDYTRAIENRRTLDILSVVWKGVAQELDILSLSNNLYGHNIITRSISSGNIDNEELAIRYLGLRSIVAKRSVAENSFNAIVGLKALGSSAIFFDGEQANTWQFVGKMLQDLGIPEEEVVDYLGLNTSTEIVEPYHAHLSYYAVLELISKKIYQNPNFFANLYDTPANVKRKSAALKAFELMLDRAIYESQLRQEMAMSVLLAARLQPDIEAASTKLEGAN